VDRAAKIATPGAQPDLVFSRQRDTTARERAPAGLPRDRGWMTAQQIGGALRWSDRLVRETASASDAVISYPGPPGCKLPGGCTRDEYGRRRLARRSQAGDMIAKVTRTGRAHYRRPPLTP
jgi:hypothetical protein